MQLKQLANHQSKKIKSQRHDGHLTAKLILTRDEEEKETNSNID